MSDMQLKPSILKGKLAVPESKSLAHRIAIAAALAGKDPSRLGLGFSNDIRATIDGIGRIMKGNPVIFCEESASTLRFLLPISLVIGRGCSFIMAEGLAKRPLTPYFPVFNRCSILYGYEPIRESVATQAQNGFHRNPSDQLFRVGGRLTSDDYMIDGSVSSQFISGLLFALPLLPGDSTLRVTGLLESRAYVDLTIHILHQFGIHIAEKENQVFHVKGNQRYRYPEALIELEGDYSQAAFFLCANALGSSVEITNLNPYSLQGDQKIIEFLHQMRACRSTGKTFFVDGSQCPDLMPILAVTAALQQGLHTEIRGARRLRMKECDRIHGICQEMQELGATIIERQDGFIIEGKEKLPGGIMVWSHNDHRIAMCMAIASTACSNPVVLKDWECVRKSYPSFFEDFKKLGGSIDEWNLGK